MDGHGSRGKFQIRETKTTITEENRARAEEFKEKANSVLKNGDYQKAVQLYTCAIEFNPFVASYYGNRSLAYLKAERFGDALWDASTAISVDSSYIKAFYRRGSANMALGEIESAMNDFRTVIAETDSSEAKAKLQECKERLSTSEHKKTSQDSKTGPEKLLIPHNQTVLEGSEPTDPWVNCQDNHLHEMFLQINDFDKLLNHESFPAALRSEETKAILREFSDRTVRIKVGIYSPNRPDVFLGSDKPFPGCKKKGGEIKTYGTGFVIPGKVHVDQNCPCKKCLGSDSPKRKYQVLYVLTASHVIYDDEEAKASKFYLFYDKRNSEKKKFYGLKLDDGDEYKEDDDDNNCDNDDDDGSSSRQDVGGVDGNDGDSADSFELTRCQSGEHLFPHFEENKKNTSTDGACVGDGGVDAVIHSKPITSEKSLASDPSNSSFAKLLELAKKIASKDTHGISRCFNELDNDGDIGVFKNLLLLSNGLGFPFGGSNLIVDDFYSFYDQACNCNIKALMVCETSDDRVKMSKAFERCKEYLMSIKYGDVVGACKTLLLRLQDMESYDNKEGKNAHFSADADDPNTVLHNRKQMYDALTRMASLIKGLLKERIEEVIYSFGEFFALFSRLEKGMMTENLNTSIRDNLNAVREKVFNTNTFLVTFRSAVYGMASGDFRDTLRFMKFVIDICQKIGESSCRDSSDDDGEMGPTRRLNDITETLLYFKDLDAYVTGTVFIFLNLLIPIFWEGNFSGFACNEGGTCDAIEFQFVFWLLLFDRLEEGVNIALNQIPKPHSFHPNDLSVRTALSFASLFAEASSVHAQKSTDTKFRKYMTEQVVVKCVTHELKVIDRFSKMELLPPKLPFTFIISHPHGYFKRIAFGRSSRLTDPGHYYVEFELRKETKYRLSSDAKEPLPDMANVPAFLSSGTAIKPGEVYHLHCDLRVAIPYKVLVDKLKNVSATGTSCADITWLTFPPGLASIVCEHHGTSTITIPVPKHLQFGLAEDFYCSPCVEHYLPRCAVHNVRTCPGSSGSFVHDSEVYPNVLLTHCGRHYEEDGSGCGYTSLTLPIIEQYNKKTKLKDVLAVRPTVLVGGRHVPIYPGPKT